MTTLNACKYTIVKEALSSKKRFIFRKLQSRSFGSKVAKSQSLMNKEFLTIPEFELQCFLSLPKKRDRILKPLRLLRLG